MITLTLDEYMHMRADYIGVCLECGAHRDCTEPDAEGYDCEECDAPCVMGVEIALVAGEIEVIDDNEEER